MGGQKSETEAESTKVAGVTFECIQGRAGSLWSRSIYPPQAIESGFADVFTKTISLLARPPFCFVYILEHLTVFSPNGQQAKWSLRRRPVTEKTPVVPEVKCQKR